MYIDLVRSIFSRPGRRWPAASGATALGMAALVGVLYAGTPAESVAKTAAATAAEARSDAASTALAGGELDQLEARVRQVTTGLAELDEYYRTTVAPIERVLHRYGADDELARHISVALVREANSVEVKPQLLLAVLLVENPWLDPKIRSPVGAIGLMQVMPVHLGAWSACEPDLEDIDANICHGARIFAHYFRQANGNIDRALLRYNGCVRGTNTPNCHQYPNHVFARAGRASVMDWLSNH